MSHSRHQSFGDETRNPEARGSGVWASRDPEAATSGQAATTTHTPGRQPPTTPCQPDRIQVRPPLRAGSAQHTPGAMLTTEFRDCDGPVHKDTAGSSSQSRNHLHPTRGPITTGYRRNASTRAAGTDDGA